MDTDWGALYREHVADVSALAGDLTEAELDTWVPGTPAWTVHEVYAHLSGGPSDAVTGRMDGAPGPEWTSRHVSERRLLPIADLVEELRSHQDAMVASLEGNPRPALVWDIAVHHADLHEALGKHRMDEHLWLPIVEALAPQRAAGLAEAGVPPYELFRGLFSRRSRAQMQAWGTGLGDAELDAVGVFGPREDDQPVPA
jgi:hypothetical protein